MRFAAYQRITDATLVGPALLTYDNNYGEEPVKIFYNSNNNTYRVAIGDATKLTWSDATQIKNFKFYYLQQLHLDNAPKLMRSKLLSDQFIYTVASENMTDNTEDYLQRNGWETIEPPEDWLGN